MTAAATDSLACIDLSDNDAFVQQVPYGWFDALRRADPVHWQPERQGRGFWAVTSHADVVAVSRDWATFSSQTGASALEDLAPGQRIAAGDKVVVWYTSANRDEAVFPDPYRLDLRRSPNPHTTFGRGGPHRCLGEHLARLELRAVLRELLPVLPRLRPDGPPARIRSNFTNGLKRFPVRVT